MSSFDIHIGEEIKKELEKQKLGITWLSRKLYCDRSNIYDIFKRSSLDTGLLLRISTVLNRNFFELYSNELSRHNIIE